SFGAIDEVGELGVSDHARGCDRLLRLASARDVRFGHGDCVFDWRALATGRPASWQRVGFSLDGISDLESGWQSPESEPSHRCLDRKTHHSHSWDGRESKGLSKASGGSWFGSRSGSLRQDRTPPGPSESKSLLPSSPCYQESSREREFLLQLLGRQRPERSLALQAAAQQVDWRRLFRITPPDLTAYLAYKTSEHGFAGQCPVELLREAGHARLATAARWLRLRFELQNLVSEFTRHEVEFVILKGAVLAFLAYPDSSLRSVSDIDLLVRLE